MTLALLNEIGVKTSFIENKIKVLPLTTHNSQLITVESDWSSASYWYSIIALSDIGTEVKLSSYKTNSLQADAALVDIYKNFGVETQFENDSIIIRKSTISNQHSLIFNLQSSPDIAQTIAVTCFGLGLECKLSGLHTLKIKETDRLLALKTEIEKLGGNVDITDDSLHLEANSLFESDKTQFLEVLIATYNDHRMAMAFAPLALKRNLIIEDAMVVSKSYPSFWDNLKSVGFKIS